MHRQIVHRIYKKTGGKEEEMEEEEQEERGGKEKKGKGKGVKGVNNEDREKAGQIDRCGFSSLETIVN